MECESLNFMQPYAADSSNDQMMTNTFVYRHVVAVISDIENKTNREDIFTLSNTEFELIVFLADQFTKLLELSRDNATISELLGHVVPQIIEVWLQKVVKPLPNIITDDFSYICYLCDEEIKVTNNDIQSSLQLHLKSPSHLETVEIFERIRKCSSSEESKDVDGNSKLKESNDTISEKSKFIAKAVSRDEKPTKGNDQKNITNVKNAIVGDGVVTEKNVELNDAPTISSFETSASVTAEKPAFGLSEKQSLHQLCCSSCHRSFSTEIQLADHVLVTHNQRKITKPSSAMPKYICKKLNANYFYCVLCLGTIHSLRDVKSHVDSVTHKNRVFKVDGATDNSTDVVITMEEDGNRLCVLCDVSLPSQNNFDAHVFGRLHRANVEMTLGKKLTSKLTAKVPSTTSTIASKSTTSTIVSKSASLSSLNSTSPGTKATSSVGKCSTSGFGTQTTTEEKFSHNHTIQSQTSTVKSSVEQEFIRSVSNKYYCSLCNVYFPMGNGQIENHVRGSSHKRFLANKSSTIRSSAEDAKSCLVNAHDGGKYCTVCEVPVPNGFGVSETHLNSRAHLWHIERRTNESLRPPMSSDFVNHNITAEMMIGVGNSSSGHFCSLCNVRLPGYSQLYQHTHGTGHKLQVEQYKRRQVNTKSISSKAVKLTTASAMNASTTTASTTTASAKIKNVEQTSSVSAKRPDTIQSNVSSNSSHAKVISKPLTDDKRTCVTSKRCDACELDLSNEYEYGEHLKSSFHKLHAELEETQLKMVKHSGQDLLERIDAAANLSPQALNQQYSAYVGMPSTHSHSQQRPNQSTVPATVYPSSASITHSQHAFTNPYAHLTAPSTIGAQQSVFQTQLSEQGILRPTSSIVNNSLPNESNSNSFNETITGSNLNGASNENYGRANTDEKLVDDRRLENGVIQKDDKSFYCMYCNTAIPLADGFEAHIGTESHFLSKEKSREDSCVIS